MTEYETLMDEADAWIEDGRARARKQRRSTGRYCDTLPVDASFRTLKGLDMLANTVSDEDRRKWCIQKRDDLIVEIKTFVTMWQSKNTTTPIQE